MVCEIGKAYCLSETFFERFDYLWVMKNHKMGNEVGYRPYICAFQDPTDPEIYWMVPLSTKLEKFQKLAQIRKDHGNEKHFGIYILGFGGRNKKAAAVISSLIPIREADIKSAFEVSGDWKGLEQGDIANIHGIAKGALDAHNRGIPVLCTPVSAIYAELLKEGRTR